MKLVTWLAKEFPFVPSFFNNFKKLTTGELSPDEWSDLKPNLTIVGTTLVIWICFLGFCIYANQLMNIQAY